MFGRSFPSGFGRLTRAFTVRATTITPLVS